MDEVIHYKVFYIDENNYRIACGRKYVFHSTIFPNKVTCKSCIRVVNKGV